MDTVLKGVYHDVAYSRSIPDRTAKALTNPDISSSRMTESGNNLFREAAVEAKQTRLEGVILLSRSSKTNMAAIFLTVSVMGLAIWGVTGRYARLETVNGILATNAESARIVALKPGLITKLMVADGQNVEQGQPLAQILIELPTANSLPASMEELEAIDQQKSLAVGQAEASRVRGNIERNGLATANSAIERQIANIDKQQKLQSLLISSLQGILDRYRPIADRGFISKTEIDRREQDLINARQGLAHLEQQSTVLEAEKLKNMAALRQSKAEETIQVASARSSAAGFRVQQAQLKSIQSYTITAPVPGTVTALQAGVGRTVEPAFPLMTIVPHHSEIHADLYAPSRSIGFLRKNQEVRLMLDAFPYQRFGSYPGHIEAISGVALDPRQIDAPFKLDEAVYRIRVKPEQQYAFGFGERLAFQPGMTIKANIVLERRSFLDWLLEPINAIRKRDK